MTDEPSKLVDAIDVAKATKQIVMQNIVIARRTGRLYQDEAASAWRERNGSRYGKRRILPHL